MSDKDNEYKGSSFWQLIIVIPGTILAFTLLIALIAKAFGVLGNDVKEPAAAIAQVDENIKPVASVEVAAAGDAGAKAKSGEEIYNSVCMMCHQAGLMAAPVFGDKEQWKPRIAQGYDMLVSHAVNGIRNMPAKGGNASLSDDEVASAVVHMANAAGANFKAPVADEVDAVLAESATTEAAPVQVAASSGKSGEEVYKSVCMMCHQAGLMAAPIFGDKEQWKPRIAQGYDTLVTHAVKGIRNMPAKGGNPSLSDDEVAAAVKHMANASGASF
jgi:cytochrome c5